MPNPTPNPSSPPTGPTPSPSSPPPLTTAISGKLVAWVGVLIAAFGFLNTVQQSLHILPSDVAAWVTVVGAALAKFGGLLHTDQASQ